jgi:hypothetical protein
MAAGQLCGHERLDVVVTAAATHYSLRFFLFVAGYFKIALSSDK